jgi:uncharacterized phage protein (TIGR02218 family)
MKTLSANLTAHIAQKTTTMAEGLLITRLDGQQFAFTSHDRDIVAGGITYKAEPGLIVSGVTISAGLAVGNLQLTTLHDGTVFKTADILDGVWRNASFTLFRANWANVSDGSDTLITGSIGEVTLNLNTVVAELLDLRQYLNQPVGSPSTKTCRYRLGDSRCTKDITVAPFTVTGTLTSVTDNQIFRDSARAEAIDYFKEGEFTFTSGNNNGITAKIKDYAADGTFMLMLPLSRTVAGNETYTAVVGCLKRLSEDCITKFNNVLNFGGEPHRPGIDAITQSPTVSV